MVRLSQTEPIRFVKFRPNRGKILHHYTVCFVSDLNLLSNLLHVSKKLKISTISPPKVI